MPNQKAESSDEPEGAPRDRHYWVNKFKGTPLSIVLPPYIRFLQGFSLLQNALILLRTTQVAALDGHEELAKVVAELEHSREARELGLGYETYFASQLTISLVSEVENFLGSAISAALRLYPQKMGKHSFSLSEIIAASSNDELIDRASAEVMNSLMYEKPLDYFKKFSDILSVKTEEIEDLWPTFVELKARRDIGIHNNWEVNDIYLRKVSEAKVATSCTIGDILLPDFEYVTASAWSCSSLIEKLVEALGEKWIPVLDKSHAGDR